MVDEMNTQLKINDNHLQYLQIQKGGLHKYIGDRVLWEKNYILSLEQQFGSIAPFLPEKCDSILDVGSGLGGIDIFLSRHYKGEPHVYLLDGVADEPVVHLHRKTFNDMQVAKDFHRINGSENFGYYSPENLQQPVKCQLVLSLGSWCFHYSPETYTAFVLRCCENLTTIVVDVRRDKPLWDAQLKRFFGEGIVIHSAKKFERRVYVA